MAFRLYFILDLSTLNNLYGRSMCKNGCSLLLFVLIYLPELGLKGKKPATLNNIQYLFRYFDNIW